MTNTFNAGTYHESIYVWHITTPESLTIEDIKELIAALTDYTNTFDNEQLAKMLEDAAYIEPLGKSKLPLFKQCRIQVRCTNNNTEIVAYSP